MKRSEEEFWRSSYKKVTWVLGEYKKEVDAKLSAISGESQGTKEIKSMKEMVGW